MPLKFRWETEFKESEIGEIPRDWEVETLCWAVRSLESGNRPKGGVLKHDPAGVLSIGGENITWQGDLMLDNCLRFSEEFYKSLRRGKIEKKDILLVKDGATIGKLAFIKEIPEGKALVNEHVFLIKTDREKYNPRYLFYYLFSDIGQSFIESSISGSAQGGINKSILDTIKISRLNLPEQSRIATVLSYFDNLIENKKRQNEILEKTAMAIFKNWFIDFEPFKDEEFVDSEIGKIPKGWEVKRLGEIVKIETGSSAPQNEKYFENGHLPFIRVKHLSNGVCISEYDVINDLAIKDYDLKLYPQGSIVFQRSGESLKEARINLLPFDGYVVNHLSVIDAKKVNDLHYIFCYLKFCLSDIIESAYAGTSLPYLRTPDIENFKILLPPPLILQKFHSLVEPLFQKIITNQKQIMVLRKIRDTLLPLLVFGKLRVEEV